MRHDDRGADRPGRFGRSGGPGRGDRCRPLLVADGSTPRRTITGPPEGDYCYDGPDCDPVPIEVPIPDDGDAEGQADYACDRSADDCHVLVVETAERRLHELYNSTKDGDARIALGAFVRDLTETHPDGVRGDQCTSADAGRLPHRGAAAHRRRGRRG